MDDFQDKLKTSDTDGALVVARAMVQACVQDELLVADLAEMARYAQLLAGRLRLPVVESHKIVLAAWLRGLAATPEVFDIWKKQYELETILDPFGDVPDDGVQSVGREILDLLSVYQQLRRENPQSAQVEVMRRELRTIWAVNSRRQTILAKFMLVLNDESFLKSLEVPVAKILLVDPGEIVSSMLSMPLKTKGYQVRVVCNVQEAIVALSVQIPDIVIVEMDMPLENGLVLCANIKTDPKLLHLPVIMLTSSKSQRVYREAMKAGAEDVL
ncbi:MAG: response regulator, partial [bacterium]